MDSPTGSWLSALGVNNPNLFTEFDFMNSSSIEEEFASHFTKDFPDYILSPTTTTATPFLQPPPIPPGPNRTSNSSSRAPVVLNFSSDNNNMNPQEKAVVQADRPLMRSSLPHDENVSEINGRSLTSTTSESVQLAKKTRRVRPPYDHITAERKRRELLSQRFLALSGMVPGLKKMDKTTVLGDTIKYLKHLQERVQTLEEQGKKQIMESVMLVRKPRVIADDEAEVAQPLPEIEARRCDSQILLKIHCDRRKGVLVELLRKVEKLNLNVINTNVAPFGNMALYITIVVEMEKEFNLTMKDIAKDIRSTLLQPPAL